MKILGIGNALMDIVTSLEDETLLERFNLPKGSMTLIDRQTSNYMNKETLALKKTLASGGSAANTIHGLSNLGMETSFIGKIGQDDLGTFFMEDMKKAGINPILYKSLNDTGRVIAFVSPDSERTMATYLGASVELSPGDLMIGDFTGFHYVYIEGYLINNPDLVKQAMKIAKENGIKICIDLASYNIVEQYREVLLKDVLSQADIIFANEDEARVLTGAEPLHALEIISGMCDIAVVKTGAEGSLIKKGDEQVNVPALMVDSIDTTGAGDIYASGFLYGQAKGLSLEKSASIGTLLASEVIQIMGPKLEKTHWEELKEKIRNIENL
ncbi:MAG: adenosine kinase [Bacteroidota bacterium]